MKKTGVRVLKKNGESSERLLESIEIDERGRVYFDRDIIFENGRFLLSQPAYHQFRKELQLAQNESDITKNINQANREIEKISQERNLESIQDDAASVIAPSVAPSVVVPSVAQTDVSIFTSAPTVSSVETTIPATKSDKFRYRLGRISSAPIIERFTAEEKTILNQPYEYFDSLENTREALKRFREFRKEAIHRVDLPEIRKNVYDRFIDFLKEQNRLNEEREGVEPLVDRHENPPTDRSNTILHRALG